MSRLLIFSFDGTSNEPSDAAQDVDYKGTKEDDNITNVLKFHLMLGGDLLPKKMGLIISRIGRILINGYFIITA